MDVTLWDSTGNNTLSDPLMDLRWTNFSGSDPTYVYTFVTTLNTAGGKVLGSHALSWAFGAGNCSIQDGGLKLGGGFRDAGVWFTIQDGAQQPELVPGTAGSSSCANLSHFAFNLTGTLNVPVSVQYHYDDRNTCAVFSDVQPLVAGNPCAAQVNPATASSISAALTATACAAAHPVFSCKSTNSTNAAAKGWEAGIRSTHSCWVRW